MNTRRRSSQTTSPAVRLISTLGILGAGGLIVVGGLSYFGLLDFGPAATPTRSRAGMVKVPRTMRPLTALTKVTREDIHDLTLGDESYFWMPQARIDAHPEWIINPADIVGRVMARNKAADVVFSEKDFLPKGSRTGLSGGVPEGKQGFFVDAAKIPGLELLRMGDTFDLLAGLPEEALEQPEAEYGMLAGGIKVRGGKPIPLSGVRLLVQGASMVAVTRGRDMTTRGVMDLPEPSTRGRTADTSTQITIAIDPEEVVPLTQALAADRPIHCVAGSGREPAESRGGLKERLASMIAFPATARPIKAFTRVSAEDLADPDTGELRTYYFPPDAVPDGWITSVDELIGRVVARDTSAGFVFSDKDFLPAQAAVTEIQAYARITGDDLADPVTAAELTGRVVAREITPGSVISEDDLLPPNAAAGIAGGTPVGRLAVSLELTTLPGISHLRRGDRFDLLASVPFNPGEAFAVTNAATEVSGSPFAQSELTDRARNTVLAEAAMVVDIDAGTATIAVLPQEVPGITKAITLGLSVYAIARSGRTGEASPDMPTLLQSDPNPLNRITLVEELVGGQRTVRVFTKSRP